MLNMLFYSRAQVEPATAQYLVSEYVKATALEMDVTAESIEPYIEGHQNFPGGFHPGGDFLVVEIPGVTASPSDGQVAGCVGIRRIDDHLCEMKSLWVEPQWRGRGAASALIEASVKRSAELGYQRMGLDVLPTRQAAIKLYRKLGFETCACHHEYEFEMVGLAREL